MIHVSALTLTYNLDTRRVNLRMNAYNNLILHYSESSAGKKHSFIGVAKPMLQYQTDQYIRNKYRNQHYTQSMKIINVLFVLRWSLNFL